MCNKKERKETGGGICFQFPPSGRCILLFMAGRGGFVFFRGGTGRVVVFFRGGTGRFFFFSEAGRGGFFFFFSTGREGAVFFVFFRGPGRDGCFWRWQFFWWDGAKSLHRSAKGGLNRPASRPCKALDYLIGEDGWGPQWRPESAEIFIFRNILWPSGRFLLGFFFKNYLGLRGQKVSLKLSSGAQSENLEPSLTIQEFFSKKYSWFYMQRMCTLFG